MDDLFIQLGITAILQAVKNEAKRAQLKKALLKVRNAINMAYANDPDFK